MDFIHLLKSPFCHNYNVNYLHDSPGTDKNNHRVTGKSGPCSCCSFVSFCFLSILFLVNNLASTSVFSTARVILSFASIILTLHLLSDALLAYPTGYITVVGTTGGGHDDLGQGGGLNGVGGHRPEEDKEKWKENYLGHDGGLL